MLSKNLEVLMNRTANISGRGDYKKLSVGLLNTQNLLTVYWLLANQPEVFARGVQRQGGRSRNRH